MDIHENAVEEIKTEGLEPMPESSEQPTESETERKKRLTRMAYNRTGLSVLTLYGAMQVIAVVAMAVILIPAAFIWLFQSPDLWDAFESSNVYESINSLKKAFLEGPFGTCILIATIVGTGVGLGFGILFQKLVNRKIPSEKIPKRTLSFGEFFLYLVVALGVWGVGVYVGNLPSLFGLSSYLDDYMEQLYQGPGMILSTVYAVIGAPILEELAFCKVLLDKLHGYGEWTAALTSAMMFGLFHGNSTQFFLAFNVGLIFAVIYMKTGHVGYSMFLHFTINFIGSISEIFGYFGLTGIGPFSFDDLVFILLAVFAVVGLTVLLLTRNKEQFQTKRSDCPDLHRMMVANPGMLIFSIFIAASVVMMDMSSLLMNLTAGKGVLSLLTLVPTAVFIVFFILFFTRVGRSNDLPAQATDEVDDNTVE